MASVHRSLRSGLSESAYTCSPDIAGIRTPTREFTFSLARGACFRPHPYRGLLLCDERKRGGRKRRTEPAAVRALDLTHGSIYGLAIRLLRPCGDRRSVGIGCKDSCYRDRMNSMYGRGSSLRRFCQIAPW